jgi:hypothetical protein
VHSVHEFHIRYQTDAETRGWRNVSPWATQRLPDGHASD